LSDAYKEGEKAGRLASTVGYGNPVAPYQQGRDYSLWLTYMSSFWFDGFKAGQIQRKSEMAALMAEDVKVAVAKAIAELPDCKEVQEVDDTSYDYPNGITTVRLKDGRRLVKYNGLQDWREMPKVPEVEPARTFTVDGEVRLR
jgi:hypothetical protein